MLYHTDQMSRDRIKLDELKLTIWKHNEKTIRDWKTRKRPNDKQVPITPIPTHTTTKNNKVNNMTTNIVNEVKLDKENSNTKLSIDQIKHFNLQLQQHL